MPPYLPRWYCVALGLALSVLTACSPPPRLDARVSPSAQAAPYPVLSPTAPLLAATTPDAVPETTAETLDGRAARLRSRAASLRGQTVVDAESRARLSQ